MRKNKKLLMFLALNSLATSFAGTTNQVSAKYDKLYTLNCQIKCTTKIIKKL